jgi:hypothetical protein
MPKRKREESKKEEKKGEDAEPPAELPKETEDTISKLIDLTSMPVELWEIVREYTERPPVYRTDIHYTRMWELYEDDMCEWSAVDALNRVLSLPFDSPKKTLIGGYWWTELDSVREMLNALWCSETTQVLGQIWPKLLKNGDVRICRRYAF